MSSDKKLICAVDFVLGIYVNEAIHGFQSIINHFLLQTSLTQEENACEYDDLTHCLTLICNVIKVQFPKHFSRKGDGYNSPSISQGKVMDITYMGLKMD
jgi:hypothetical protein